MKIDNITKDKVTNKKYMWFLFLKHIIKSNYLKMMTKTASQSP